MFYAKTTWHDGTTYHEELHAFPTKQERDTWIQKEPCDDMYGMWECARRIPLSAQGAKNLALDQMFDGYNLHAVAGRHARTPLWFDAATDGDSTMSAQDHDTANPGCQTWWTNIIAN